MGAWRPEVRFNETTGTYFRRLAAISSPEQAERYRNVLVPNSKKQTDADEYFLDNEPAHVNGYAARYLAAVCVRLATDDSGRPIPVAPGIAQVANFART